MWHVLFSSPHYVARPGLRNMPPDMGNLGIPAPLGEPSLQQGRVPRGLGGIGRGIGGGGMMPRIL